MNCTMPSSPPNTTPISTQTTPTPSPPTIVQSPSIAIGANTAGTALSAIPFPIPTLTSADWLRLQQVNSLACLMPPPSSNQAALANQAAPAKKPRGRPWKPKAAPSSQPVSQRVPDQPSQQLSYPSIQTQVHSNAPPDAQTDSESQSNTQLEESIDPNKSQTCWFTPQVDGQSDMDVVAEWCSIFEHFDLWRTKRKEDVGDMVAEYLSKQDHTKRSGQECKKKVALLEKWFREADGLRKETGQGNLDGNTKREDIKFKVSKDEIDSFKLLKRRGGHKKKNEGGTLQVRILRICPWYEDLEPIIGDRPSANPLALRDSLLNLDNQDQLNTHPEFDEDVYQTLSKTEPYKGWEPTPPRQLPCRRNSMSLELEADENPSSQESTMNVSNVKPRLRAPTPSASKESSKCRRVSYNPSFSVEAKMTIPQDPSGLKSIVERFPTHEQ
ncbi:hypothetical protein DFH28DRAFT_940310 [Melampsora americana]|nr:hypothetical protein DFH28DRAFT_940310 [Melampsora americana]